MNPTALTGNGASGEYLISQSAKTRLRHGGNAAQTHHNGHFQRFSNRNYVKMGHTGSRMRSKRRITSSTSLRQHTSDIIWRRRDALTRQTYGKRMVGATRIREDYLMQVGGGSGAWQRSRVIGMGRSARRADHPGRRDVP